jgi:hypothetical protein
LTQLPIELRKLGRAQAESKENVSHSPKMDPKWSPDSKFVSFVRDGDIWVVSVETGVEQQLTFSRSSNKHKSAGVAEFIIEEEFDRYTGYWWSPAVASADEK